MSCGTVSGGQLALEIDLFEPSSTVEARLDLFASEADVE
jgi:hypothetical protein